MGAWNEQSRGNKYTKCMGKEKKEGTLRGDTENFVGKQRLLEKEKGWVPHV